MQFYYGFSTSDESTCHTVQHKRSDHQDLSSQDRSKVFLGDKKPPPHQQKPHHHTKPQTHTDFYTQDCFISTCCMCLSKNCPFPLPILQDFSIRLAFLMLMICPKALCCVNNCTELPFCFHKDNTLCVILSRDQHLGHRKQ